MPKIVINADNSKVYAIKIYNNLFGSPLDVLSETNINGNEYLSKRNFIRHQSELNILFRINTVYTKNAL